MRLEYQCLLPIICLFQRLLVSPTSRSTLLEFLYLMGSVSSSVIWCHYYIGLVSIVLGSHNTYHLLSITRAPSSQSPVKSIPTMGLELATFNYQNTGCDH